MQLKATGSLYFWILKWMFYGRFSSTLFGLCNCHNVEGVILQLCRQNCNCLQRLPCSRSFGWVKPVAYITVSCTQCLLSVSVSNWGFLQKVSKACETIDFFTLITFYRTTSPHYIVMDLNHIFINHSFYKEQHKMTKGNRLTMASK